MALAERVLCAVKTSHDNLGDFKLKLVSVLIEFVSRNGQKKDHPHILCIHSTTTKD